MINKAPYQTPAVEREIQLLMTGRILEASLVDKAEVVTKGQEVENFDFSPDNTGNYNHTWE